MGTPLLCMLGRLHEVQEGADTCQSEARRWIGLGPHPPSVFWQLTAGQEVVLSAQLLQVL